MSLVIDLNETITITERAGIIREVKRKAIKTGTWGTIPAAVTAIAGDAGIPVVGNPLTMEGQTVYLEDRDITIKSRSIIEIEMTYRRQEEDEFTFRGSTSLQQITTQFALNGDQITVSHNGVTQGGSVDVLAPGSTLELEFVTASASPGSVSTDWTGKVNSDTWQGGAAGTWICMNVTFDPVDLTAATPKYRFTFSFEYREDGWDPTVVFIDPETGEPPDGLVDGTGVKTVVSYATKDFNTPFS